ncbi:MAG: DUF899 domain-containing protein [Solirubrobacterales bacterium]
MSANTPPTVSPEQWRAARAKLLVKEKQHVKAGDALAAERRRMPWLKIEKDYEFDGPDGRVKLIDLFEGRQQLIIYRFFFDPDVTGHPDAGCPGCSFMADQVGRLEHINARGTTFAQISRGKQEDIKRLKEKMDWQQIPWYTITDDFDVDMDVGEWHGTNAFIRDGEDNIYRTYFIDARGDEKMGNPWAYLDITALGRQEEWEDSPEGYPQTAPYQWWRRHNEYDMEEAAKEMAEQIERNRSTNGTGTPGKVTS